MWKLSLRDTDISEHLLILYALGIGHPLKTIVEIGAGQSTYVLTTVAHETTSQFYSIDLTKEARERAFPNAPNLDEYGCYHFIQGNSMDVLWDKPIDLLFIDSGHTYDLTIGELTKYGELVNKRGFIVMHDTGEFNTQFQDCRRAMHDYTRKLGWEIKQWNNQNGLTVIRKI